MKHHAILAGILCGILSVHNAVTVFAAQPEENPLTAADSTAKISAFDDPDSAASSDSNGFSSFETDDESSSFQEDSALSADSESSDFQESGSLQNETESAKPSEDASGKNPSDQESSEDKGDSEDKDDSEESDESEEPSILHGRRITQLSEIEESDDYLIVQAGSSKQTPLSAKQLEEFFKQDKPVVFEYEWIDQKVTAGMEAYRFYSLIRSLDHSFIPLVRVDSITTSTGPRYIREMLDAFYSLSHVQPLLVLGSSAQAKGDWRCLKDVYTIWDDPALFEGTKEELNAFGKPVEGREDIEELDRLYNPNSGEHFYTIDRHERDVLIELGWKYEGTGWSVPKEGTNVYRLYNPNAGDHHYTLDQNERSALIRLGWKDEGVSWKSVSSKNNPVYRAYNPNAKAGSHHFSVYKHEISHLVSVGWKNENIAWYAADPLLALASYPDGNYLIERKAYNSSGAQITGVQAIGAKMYYFNPELDGEMDTKPGLRVLSNGSRILIEGEGNVATGVRRIEGRAYVFDPNTGLARTNVWHLMDGSYDGGRISFMYFNEQGIGTIQSPPRSVEEAALVRNGGISTLVDSISNVRVPFKDYIRAHYGNERINSFMDEAIKYEGRPYVWAGKDPRTGFDCSGLMTWCMRKQWGVPVNPMMTSAQAVYSSYCRPISQAEAVPGDFVFWKWTYGSNRESITHTAIYVGNGWTYQAGDPIGFYPIETSKNVAGETAQYLFGRLR